MAAPDGGKSTAGCLVVGSILAFCVSAVMIATSVRFIAVTSAIGADDVLYKGLTPPLNADPQIACSACEMVVGLVASLMKNPNRGLLGRKVLEKGADGEDTAVRYVTSSVFVKDLLGIVCNNSVLSGLKLTENWYGKREYTVDGVPNYSKRSQVESSLHKACKIMAKGKYRAALMRYLPMMIEERSTMTIQMVTCGHVFDMCVWKRSRWSSAKMRIRQAFLHDPSVVVRLLPFVVIILSLPFLIIPVLKSIGRGGALGGAGSCQPPENESQPSATDLKSRDRRFSAAKERANVKIRTGQNARKKKGGIDGSPN